MSYTAEKGSVTGARRELRRAMYRRRRESYAEQLETELHAARLHREAGDSLELDALRLQERVRVSEKVAITAQAEKNAGRRHLVELEQQVVELQEGIKKRDARIQEANKVLEQAKAQVLRSRQDMEQQRRRFERQSLEVRRSAEEKLLADLFPVLDNFTYALETTLKTADPEGVTKGIGMIHRELMTVFEQNGLAQVFPLNMPFDPQIHDAVSAISKTSIPNNHVVQVLRPGYTLRGKVLRPAMVVVNKLAEQDSPTPPALPAVPDPEAVKEETPDYSREARERTPLDHAWRIMETRADE